MDFNINDKYLNDFINYENSEDQNSFNKINSSIRVEPPSAIFQLNVDCFHEIFDWLSLKDLISIGQTCKRLQRIAGNFFHTNYAVKMARITNDIHISSHQSNVFRQYIPKISISGDRLKSYHFVGANCFNSIKHIRIHSVLPDGGFECIKGILTGVESLEMNECIVNGDFYEDCLKYCPNLRTISVTRSDRIRNKSIIIGTGNEWLLRKYPKLEQFELNDSYRLKTNELKIFFEENPNVRTFSTDSRTLWANRYTFIDTDIKLDILAIDIYQMNTIDRNKQSISMIDSIHQLLSQLYENGSYNHLHLYIFFINEHNVDKLLSLKAIEMIMGDVIPIKAPLNQLKAFGVWNGDDIIANNECLPCNLPHLQRMYFSNVTCDCVLHFIRYWPQLKEIRITRFHEGIHFKTLDLIKLNKEREKLAGARNVKIYVKDDLYLATKWTIKTTQLSMIELRRANSMEWEESSARSKFFKTI